MLRDVKTHAINCPPSRLAVQAEQLDVFHVIGNHCLTAGRRKVLDRLRQPACYWQRQVCRNIRLLEALLSTYHWQQQTVQRPGVLMLVLVIVMSYL